MKFLVASQCDRGQMRLSFEINVILIRLLISEDLYTLMLLIFDDLYTFML